MKTLVWDVDDVLAPTMRTWLERTWRPAHASAPAYEGLRENPPHEILGVSREAYHASLDGFRRTEYESMTPRPEALAFFRDAGARYRHAALTATPRAHAPTVLRWVLHHFGDWIRVVGFVPSWRAGDEGMPPVHPDKGAWMRELARADALIDDSPTNIAAAEAMGAEGFLVGQPWNEGDSLAAILSRLR